MCRWIFWPIFLAALFTTSPRFVSADDDTMEIRRGFEALNLDIALIREDIDAVEQKAVEDLNALDSKLSTVVRTTENIVKDHDRYALQQEKIWDSINEKIKNFQAETKLQMDSQSETSQKIIAGMLEILKIVTEVQSEQTELKSDVAVLKSEQKNLVAKVEETNIEQIKTSKINWEIKSDLAKLATDVEVLSANQSHFTKKLQKELVRETVTIFETGVKELQKNLSLTDETTINQLLSLESEIQELNIQINKTLTERAVIKKIVKPLCARYKTVLKDCAEIKKSYSDCPNGVYLIHPTSLKETEVYCDMTLLRGGWTVIQKRVGPQNATDHRQNFFFNYKDYENGFGDVNDEYWIGLLNMAALTAAGDSELRIELTDWEGNTAYATYGSFKVGDSSTGYQLSVDNYSGTTRDALTGHSNMKFTTKDKDQDAYSGNCAETSSGGWWFHSCTDSNLNGLHANFGSNEEIANDQGIIWGGFGDPDHSLQKVTMMTRTKF